MSHQQDPAAASAPFDSHTNGFAVRMLAQGKPSALAQGESSALAQGKPSALTQGMPSALAQGKPSALAQGKPSALAQGESSALAQGESFSLAQGKPSAFAQGAATAQSEPRTIEVVAKRFTFEPARVEVTEGERVRLIIKSADGVHGVEIKKFKVNKKIPRGGEPVTIDFVASAAGEYPILCSEYCGNGHEDMKGMLVVAAKSPR